MDEKSNKLERDIKYARHIVVEIGANIRRLHPKMLESVLIAT